MLLNGVFPCLGSVSSRFLATYFYWVVRIAVAQTMKQSRADSCVPKKFWSAHSHTVARPRPLTVTSAEPCSPPEIDVYIATQRHELASAYQLVYESYLTRGYVAPHASQMVYRVVNGLPSSRTAVAVDRQQRVIGTVTIVGDNTLGLPMEAIYPEEVQALRAQGRSVAETSGLAVQMGRKQSSAVVFALTRFAVQYMCWRGYHDMLFTINPRHRRFYERLIGATPIGGCRPHEIVQGNPALAYRVDLQRIDQLPLYCKYFAEAIPISRFMQPPVPPEDHRYFCLRTGIAQASCLRVSSYRQRQSA